MAPGDSDTVELFVLGGPDLGRSAELADGAWIGRAEGCALRLGGRSISRRHARLERRGEAWFVVDQGSTNGLWLGDERVTELELVDHGEFKVGDEPLRARLGQVEPAAAQPTPAEPEAPAPAPAPAAEISFTSGGGAAPVLEEDDDLELEFDEPADQPAPSPAPATSSATSPAGVRDLQREELLASMATKKSGLFSADLEQYPAWVKALVAVGVLAFLAAIAWGVQALVLGVR